MLKQITVNLACRNVLSASNLALHYILAGTNIFSKTTREHWEIE